MNTDYLLRLVLLCSLLILSGCASIGEYRDPTDPLESYNRAMYNFNDGVDRMVVKPLSEGYKAIVPVPVDRGITNFFSNMADVGSAVNNLLQFKLQRAFTDVSRVIVNTTLGFAGLIDVASNMNLRKSSEDFGQTMGNWGIGSGPYIVLPILGPSSGRDVIGRVFDWYLDPVTYLQADEARYATRGLRLLDQRADLLGASRVMEEAALDPYEFARAAYMQKRVSDIYDGNPPLDIYNE